ncbi:futalosine hydrolase [Mucilaginibacter ginsenosidivorans]|uniref:Futalosine hydrolase n=1 Tax=Mucilaginibacter ginsenosidivorans TaxID=398053 RepID=A0A5B8UQV9_9SPHI|nr:futalosine hydrolase [Mucilaginibacter ginsenosidivorans]QEC61292.1 futalosine hydrolase [Mucilaginibacter ginsenosidivorans]
MRILVVAATEFEVEFQNQESRVKNQNIELLITGVGMVATAFALGRHLATNRYDLAINLGIAGSFDRSIAVGEVVEVVEDSFSELGAEDDETFLSIEKLGFGEAHFKPSARLYDHGITHIRQVSAITVNTVHGNEASIKELACRIEPQLESMEGAAFFYACKQAGVPCIQIRAVSNYVEKRNRDAWQIGLAIKNLNTFAAELFKRDFSPLK